ncbi:MAG: hypothetical protein NTW03_00340, partial [Verrucomicrobia bacterium]|nr:hypothetical protein [Verrucomicrobiota bacterium]
VSAAAQRDPRKTMRAIKITVATLASQDVGHLFELRFRIKGTSLPPAGRRRATLSPASLDIAAIYLSHTADF